MSNIQWNNPEQESQELSDDELPANPVGYIPTIEEIYEQEPTEEEEELDDADILKNARLRLEKGRLYEMVMTEDIFQNMDSDPQAIKSVQKELKRFAKDRMEVMLGMRQEKAIKTNDIHVVNQFNGLEVEVLKTLCKKLSGGASEKHEDNSGPQPAAKNTTITPISNNAKKTTLAPIASKAPQKKVAPQASKTPVAAPVLTKKIEDMTYDEKIKYNHEKSAFYDSNKVASANAIPMPDVHSANNIYASRALNMNNVIADLRRR